jgi:ureidoglycolate lyase
VTYAAGTWHAPMVVVGLAAVEFVVVQNTNGVEIEDCQEVEFHAEAGQDGVIVELDDQAAGREQELHMKAKL